MSQHSLLLVRVFVYYRRIDPNRLNYDGSFDGDVPVPIAGLAALDVEVESSAVGITGFWRPPVEIGEHWSYAVSMTVPFVDLTVEAEVGGLRIFRHRL